jgi:hypothetical protein
MTDSPHPPIIARKPMLPRPISRKSTLQMPNPDNVARPKLSPHIDKSEEQP